MKNQTNHYLVKKTKEVSYFDNKDNLKTRSEEYFETVVVTTTLDKSISPPIKRINTKNTTALNPRYPLPHKKGLEGGKRIY